MQGTSVQRLSSHQPCRRGLPLQGPWGCDQLVCLQWGPPGLSSNCIQLDGFRKGLSFPTCKKQREHPACSMQESNRGTGGRGRRTVHMLALEQRGPNNQKCHLSPGAAKRQEPPNLPPPHVTYGILNCRAHCGFVLEHRGHLQEGIDHLLWIRCVSLRT